jgi:hypothetical protein
MVFLIFEREYSTGVYLLSPGTEVIGAMLVSLWATGSTDLVAALFHQHHWWPSAWASRCALASNCTTEEHETRHHDQRTDRQRAAPGLRHRRQRQPDSQGRIDAPAKR